MFQQQNGLVDPTEVPLPIGLSWVTKSKTDNRKIINSAHFSMADSSYGRAGDYGSKDLRSKSH